MALRGVVTAIDQLPELTKPEIAAVEGSEATIEAFRRLTTTFFGLLAFKLPPTADELRALQQKAIQSVEGSGQPGAPGSAQARALSLNGEQAGLSKRDYVPLAVALFVDLCLLLVTMGQRSSDRLSPLLPKMRAAERGPVIDILSRFNDIHRDDEIRENFELFRHVVFDMNGDYYVAVPLDAPASLDADKRQELRVEAQLLANLFASFEKERIFKRTLLPTTGSIKKRLARQGSKFAGAEAFRVYKFADGAWSDIILGAVMGAARRIDADKRANASLIDRGGVPDAPALTAAPKRRRANGAAEVRVEPRLNGHVHEEPRAPRRRRADIDPDHASRFGPYADVYRPDPPSVASEADVTAKAANSNSAPLRAVNGAAAHATPIASDDANPSVPPMARWPSVRASNESEADEPRVILSRETASVSMPVSAATMPDSLKSALARLNAAPVIALRDASETAGNGEDARFIENTASIERLAPPAAE